MREQLGINLNWNSASLASFPTMKKDELHLWWLPLTLNKKQSAQALTLLSDIQRDKYHRRTSPELKHSYLAGRYYLLTLLGAYTDRAPEDVLLSYSRLNKPSLSEAELDLEFNFTDTNSHNGSYGVFAFSKARHVGVDIENRSREINIELIAQRRFTQQEWDFTHVDGKIDRERGLSIWTRKEAFGKATGLGINFSMNKRNLIGDEPHTINFSDHNSADWRCIQIQLGDEFISSVVHQGHEQLTLKAFNSLEPADGK